MADLTPVLDRVEATQLAEPGDHERLAHYVPKNDIMRAAIEGVPVRALCGKTWIPGRDPEKFPVCPSCQEIIEGIPDSPEGSHDD